LFGGEEVRFVDDQQDAFFAFLAFAQEEVLGLGDQCGLVEAGGAAEPGDDLGVDAAGADRGVGR